MGDMVGASQNAAYRQSNPLLGLYLWDTTRCWHQQQPASVVSTKRAQYVFDQHRMRASFFDRGGIGRRNYEDGLGDSDGFIYLRRAGIRQVLEYSRWPWMALSDRKIVQQDGAIIVRIRQVSSDCLGELLDGTA
jgi:hypothetical protein